MLPPGVSLYARHLRHDAEQRAGVAVGVHHQLHEARYAQHNDTAVDSRLRPRAGAAPGGSLYARRLRHDAEQRATVAVGVHQQLHEARYAQHNTQL